MSRLTHLNKRGEAHMVNIGKKASTHRIAIAEGSISMKSRTLSLIIDGAHKKGDVLAIARIAGIMAAKKTPELIPLCHPLSISHIDIRLDADMDNNSIHCLAHVETTGPTGVEMEALTAVQISLLTIYDMCKAVDRGMTINAVQLVKKSGGKSGTWKR